MFFVNNENIYMWVLVLFLICILVVIDLYRVKNIFCDRMLMFSFVLFFYCNR